jgi:hypothetical protein
VAIGSMQVLVLVIGGTERYVREGLDRRDEDARFS